jgi:anhydro-N-acetylmuramic acid kinase
LAEADAYTLAKTHTDYAHYLGMTLKHHLREHELQPDLIGVHGHTVFHRPDRHFTFQLGDGETMASHLPAPLVTGFRQRDMALGGQGAPLVPFGEWYLMPDYELFLNLGGIANLSFLPRSEASRRRVEGRTWFKQPPRHLGYDLCACNQVLNALARAYDPALGYDPEGQLAASGQVLPAVLAELGGLSFYHTPPPRSLGNALIAQEVWPLVDPARGYRPQDLAATFVQHIANRLYHDLAGLGLGEQSLLVTGGGALNTHLLTTLRTTLTPLGVELIAPSRPLIEFKEAMIFGFLALQVLWGAPTTLPAATGAREAAIGGSLHR